MSVNTENKIVPINSYVNQEPNESQMREIMRNAIIENNEGLDMLRETSNIIREVNEQIHDENELQRNYRFHARQEEARTTDFCKKAVAVTVIASSYFVGAHFGVVPNIPFNF